MWVYKCDRCKKIIPKEDKSKAINAGFGISVLGHHQFCRKCGEPIARILKRYKLTDKE